MEIGLLGPLLVRAEDAQLQITSAKQRALVCLLAIHPRRLMRTETLIGGLWGDNPPSTAIKTLQTHLAAVRRQLPPDVIKTVPGGYVLEVDPSTIDAWRFEKAVEQCRSLERSKHLAEARRLAEEGLSLWRGVALPDLAESEDGRAEAARLEEMRRTLEEDLADLRLWQGDHRAAISTLENATAREPLRERRWGQLMIALYRSGRQADALRAYQQLRTKLRDELGIDPSSELAQLEDAVLLHKPELDWTAELENPQADVGASKLDGQGGTANVDPVDTLAAIAGSGPGDMNLSVATANNKHFARRRLTKAASIAVGVVVLLTAVIAYAVLSGDARGLPPYARGVPLAPAAQLQGETELTCTSRDWCVELGQGLPGNPTTDMWSWTGNSWSQMPGSTMSESGVFSIFGLACASRHQCLAVGYCLCSKQQLPLVMGWDGRQWSEMSLPPIPGNDAALDSVQCPNVGDCFAVGADNGGALIEHWNGHAWARMRNPLGSVQSDLTSVSDLATSALWSLSCPTTTFCTAVGGFTDLQRQDVFNRAVSRHDFAGVTHVPNSGFNEAPAEIFSGGAFSRWSAYLLPFPPVAAQGTKIQNGLSEVACPSAKQCTALGWTRGAVQGYHQPVRDAWDGMAWTSGPPGVPLGGDLTFSCGAGACYAENYDYTTSASSDRQLIYQVDDTTGGPWASGYALSIPTTPQTAPGRDRTSQGVFACASPSFCMANGYVDAHAGCPGGERYAAEWNGLTWSVATLDVCSRDMNSQS
jgi:DNA-binding SARP family transcriptional activator